MVTHIKSLNKSSDSRREAQAKTERDRGPSHVTGCSFQLRPGFWSVGQTFTALSIFLLPVSHRFMKLISVSLCCSFTFVCLSLLSLRVSGCRPQGSLRASQYSKQPRRAAGRQDHRRASASVGAMAGGGSMDNAFFRASGVYCQDLYTGFFTDDLL